MSRAKIADLPREKWSHKFEFLLAVVGFAVDLGNIWRFPYKCYENGGGAFLIPYLLLFLLGGLPLFYLELALGQYHRSGCISIWRFVCPLFKGIGYATCIVCFCTCLFYITIIAWAVYIFFSSFTAELPWIGCNHTWNTAACFDPSDANGTEYNQDFNGSKSLAAEEYFLRSVLEVHKSKGFEYMGPIKWELAACSIFVYILIYFAIWKGPRSSGKAVWFTATMPYVSLFILLIRGLSLPGATKGISFYLRPNLKLLLTTKIWREAATQIFFSLGPGYGALIALASYNDFRHNLYRDALIASSINCLTSFLAGFVIFSVLGFMADVLNESVEQVAGEGGPGLIFIVFPQAIAMMPGSTVWSLIFFLMLVTLGLDSAFGGLEAVVTAVCDEFPNAIGSRRKLFVAFLLSCCFTAGLPTLTYGGSYLIDYLDTYCVSFSVIVICTAETIAVAWFYGVSKFAANIKEMLGFPPSWFWRVCWMVVTPALISVMLLFASLELKPLEVNGYLYPDWSLILGWILRTLTLIAIPVFAIYKLIFKSSGNPMARLKNSIHPEVLYDFRKRAEDFEKNPNVYFITTQL